MFRIHLALVVSSVAASPKTWRKRGFAGFTGDNYTCQDAALLDLSDSWHYTWTHDPSKGRQCEAEEVTSEFVPMVIGVGKAEGIMNMGAIVPKDGNLSNSMWKKFNVHHLLGYNEPDYGNGHNHRNMVSPAEAAADWPHVQRLAAMFNLDLVGPAVASGQESGGRDCWDENGRSTWLDDFFGNCTHVVSECDPSLIKYIAMHDYHGSVDGLKRKIDGAYELYGRRKIWLTEVAITQYGNPPNMDAQLAYMQELLPYLDYTGRVYRYAWFAARNAPNEQNGGSNLLALNGNKQLSRLGHVYKQRPATEVSV